MEKPIHRPYPIPEFIAYLEHMKQEPTDDPEHYACLVELLQACFDVVDEANEHWRELLFYIHDPEHYPWYDPDEVYPCTVYSQKQPEIKGECEVA
jgi:hypothetical protein